MRDQSNVLIRPICSCGRFLHCIWKNEEGDCQTSYLEIEPCKCKERGAYCQGFNAGIVEGMEERK